MNKIDTTHNLSTRRSGFRCEPRAVQIPWSFMVVTVMLLLLAVGCKDDGSTITDAGDVVPDAGAVESTAQKPVVAIRINELLAANDSGLTDEDGDFSDWLELHNISDKPVDLKGWYLTDDEEELTKWPLPAETVGPGGFLIIFASGKNRGTAAGEEPHTNFKLSGDGQYLALVQPDGITIADEYTPSYPPQFTDVSYGHTSDDAVGFLESPSAAAANSQEAVAGVEFSRSAGVFTGTLSLTMSLDSGREGTIHYTTDGSAPTPASPVYSEPLTLTKSTLVRARAFDDDQGGPGPESYAFFTAVDESVAAVTSELPLVVIDTLGATVTDDDDGSESAITVVERSEGTSTVTGQAEYSGGTSIRIRGGSSIKHPKKQFKLELHDAEGNDVDEDLLSLGSESDWILYGPGRNDRSMIANPLMQKLAGEVGLVEMQSRFVELYVNEDGGPVESSDYRGIYILGENIKIGENRADIEKLSVSDATEPDVTGGYILAIDPADSDQYNFKTESGFPPNRFLNLPRPLNVVRPKLDRLTEAQQSWIEAYVNDFEKALRGPNFDDPVVGYRAYIDVQSWIDAHLLRLFSKDVDMLYRSHYITLDRGGKLRTGPLWDFDRSLNTPDERVRDPELVWADDGSGYPFDYEWWGKLFDDAQFVAKYRDRWNELRQGPLATIAVLSNIDALAAEIAPAYPREDARWGDLPQYGSRYTDFAGEISALKDWVTKRLTFLDQALNEPL